MFAHIVFTYTRAHHTEYITGLSILPSWFDYLRKISFLILSPAPQKKKVSEVGASARLNTRKQLDNIVDTSTKNWLQKDNFHFTAMENKGKYQYRLAYSRMSF